MPKYSARYRLLRVLKNKRKKKYEFYSVPYIENYALHYDCYNGLIYKDFVWIFNQLHK